MSPFVHEEETYEGTVTEINPTIDERGLVAVKARVKNTSDTLMDGMNVRVVVENAVEQQFVVPKEAVVERSSSMTPRPSVPCGLTWTLLTAI